jgi:hypothetical protein
MILLIPYTKFTLKSNLQPDEAERLLENHVEPPKSRHKRYSRNHKYFKGMIVNKRFDISLIKLGKYETITILGQIDDDMNVSRIEVTMRLSYPQITGVLFVSGLMFFDFLSSFESWVDIGGGILLLLFIYGFLMVNFNYEAIKIRRYLEEIFQAETFNH